MREPMPTSAQPPLPQAPLPQLSVQSHAQPLSQPSQRPPPPLLPPLPPPPPPKTGGDQHDPALDAVRELKSADRSLTAKQVHALLPEKGIELSLAAVKKLCSEAVRAGL